LSSLNPGNPGPAAPSKVITPRQHAVQLIAAAGPGGRATGVSKRITFDYTIVRVLISFPPGSNNLVQAYIFLSLDADAPTNGLPWGVPLLTFLGQHPYVLGDACERAIPMAIPSPSRGSWLKLHIWNTDVFTHTVQAVFTIREREGA